MLSLTRTMTTVCVRSSVRLQADSHLSAVLQSLPAV
jgi:hypothetical protein